MGIPLRPAPDEMIRAERRALLRADAQIGCPISGSEAENICSVWALPLLTPAVIRKHSSALVPDRAMEAWYNSSIA